MKKFLFLMMVFFCMTGVVQAQENSTEEFGKIAVIPYLDVTEQEREYIPATVNELYTNYFGANGFSVMDEELVEKALFDAGYDESNQMLPEKDVMAEVAKNIGADYVVALEVSNVNTVRHESYFSTKVSTQVKLKYHFYNAEKNRMTPFQTTAANDNKAVMFGQRSYKRSIIAALTEAMEKGNEKIQSLL